MLYDRLISVEIFALIPAPTPRQAVGKEVGANAWPQAVAGAHVVRLK